MTGEPIIEPLSHRSRVWTFRILLAVFCIVMPIFVFYAMGYRLDLSNERNITTVGGMYVSADSEDVVMFVDEEPVRDMRFFQQAAYIQNLDAGVHRVHVQGEGLETWVKELPVYSRLVTEAHAFNMPSVPQVRFIPRFQTEGGLAVAIVEDEDAPLFPNASTTNLFIATTSPQTAAYVQNSEHEYVRELFNATQTPAIEGENALPSALGIKMLRGMRLFKEGEDVYATWLGGDRALPYYFCVTYTTEERTIREYGAHVYESLLDEYTDAAGVVRLGPAGSRLCRDTIRIDRMGQEVSAFYFMPASMHHVLLLLEDGIHVVEIDDRAWQNTQLLYPGEDLEVRVDNGRIYVFDGEYYFEVLTALPG